MAKEEKTITYRGILGYLTDLDERLVQAGLTRKIQMCIAPTLNLYKPLPRELPPCVGGSQRSS